MDETAEMAVTGEALEHKLDGYAVFVERAGTAGTAGRRGAGVGSGGISIVDGRHGYRDDCAQRAVKIVQDAERSGGRGV
jgi:hypothetical protein